MALIPFKDILINARQESHRMRHYFLGVEHIFIALLEIKSGLASSILSDYGYSAEYVIDAVRRRAGKGSRHRLWAGVPNSPRLELVISLAQEIAREQGRGTIQERDLLVAILEEGDNIPSHVLSLLGLDLAELRDAAISKKAIRASTQSFVRIDMGKDFHQELAPDKLFILRKMFYGYSRIRVETQLTGGYAGADLLVVTPFSIDRREQAMVVVKIGRTDDILDEAQRYEHYVRGTLPPLTARLEDRPVAPDTSDLAALKYTFLTADDGQPSDMRALVKKWTGEKLGRWLHQHLYREFGDNWWKQTRPFRFNVWQEYDWLLPPILTLQLTSHEKPPEGTHVLRVPVKRSKINELEYGDHVVVENFTVYRVEHDKQSIRLGISQGSNTTSAYQIEVRGIDFEKSTFYRGEVVERIIGQVWQTRDEQLMMALLALEPDFEIGTERISVNNILLPNPVKSYQELLDIPVEGLMSTIHGDLHLGNILIGPSESALLIDFARTRDGHTLFDWANLEVSILSEVIAPLGDDDSWASARNLLKYLTALNIDDRRLIAPPDMENALQAVIALRQIAERSLRRDAKWQEYYISLALTCLRAMTWETMAIGSRRLMYLMSALAMHEFNRRYNNDDGNTPSPDATDIVTED